MRIWIFLLAVWLGVGPAWAGTTYSAPGGNAESNGLGSISGTGHVVRTGTATYATRTITAGSSSLTVTNGSGVSGNPTVDTAQNLTTSGSPTFANLTLSGADSHTVGTTNLGTTAALHQMFDASSGSCTMALSSISVGKIFLVEVTGWAGAGTTVTVDLSGDGCTFPDGQSTYTLRSARESVLIKKASSTKWAILGSYVGAPPGYHTGWARVWQGQDLSGVPGWSYTLNGELAYIDNGTYAYNSSEASNGKILVSTGNASTVNVELPVNGDDGVSYGYNGMIKAIICGGTSPITITVHGGGAFHDLGGAPTSIVLNQGESIILHYIHVHGWTTIGRYGGQSVSSADSPTFAGLTLSGATITTNSDTITFPDLGNASVVETAGAQSIAGVKTFSDNVVIGTAGKGLQVKTGSNAMMGTAAAMSSGSVTVTNTTVATGDLIFLTRVSGTAGNAGHPSYTISNGASFTITSTNGADDSVYNWIIIRPAP